MILAAFLTPAFLWASGLLAVPLIIHLINRRRYRTVTWAAMDFLMRAYKKRNRRMRLENLLLLLIRCAIPVLLALAMARPFFGSENLLRFMAQQRRDVVLVVDESYSMNRRAGGGTLFQDALSQCRRVLDLLDPDRGDTCTILAMARDTRILVRGSRLRQEWEHALARLDRPSSLEADFGRAVEALETGVLSAIPSAPEVYLVSDFQRRTFETALAASAAREDPDQEEAPTLEERLRRMHERGVELRFINVADGEPPPENLSVLDLAGSESIAISHQNNRITATVRSFRGGSGATGSGRFLIGNRERPVSFTLDKDGQSTVEIYHSFAEAGDAAVEFRLDEDDLEDDNVRTLRIPVADSVPILVVDGDPSGAGELDGEVGELLLVLDPSFGQFDGDNLPRFFEPQWISYHEFNRGKARLDDFRAVILANVPEIDEERMVAELDNYVRRGGGVLFFLGDRVSSASYNVRLYRPDGSGVQPLPLAPEPRGEPPSLTGVRATDVRFHRIEIVDDLHPAVRTFIDDRRRKYIATPVFQYLPFEQAAELREPDRVPLRFQGSREPALVDHVVGRGHALWFLISADDEWSLFPQVTGAFFPLVWDMVSYLVSEDPSTHQLGIGDAIRKSVPFAAASFSVTRPDGEVRVVDYQPGEPVLGHFELPPFDETQVPGVYVLDVPLDAGASVRELYAVNVDPAEGDLEYLGREQLGELLDQELYEYAGEISTATRDDEPERQGEIWKSIVSLTLALLIAETVLAWRFGAYS